MTLRMCNGSRPNSFITISFDYELFSFQGANRHKRRVPAATTTLNLDHLTTNDSYI